MTRLLYISLIALLIFTNTSAEEDDHDGDEDHDHDEDHVGHEEGEHESPAHECEEEGGFYCFNPSADTACFKEGMNASHLTGGNTWVEEYCLCTESETMGANDMTNLKITAELVAGKPECGSEEREKCFHYKESMYHFYQGVCYTNVTCGDNVINGKTYEMSWKASDTVSSCAYVEDRCNRMDEAEWHEDEGECECLEEGATFHIDHCHGHDDHDDDGPTKGQQWLYGIIAVAFVSAFAVIGVLIVLFRHQWWYDLLLSFMVALAMGCLLSDATLHLIPIALGLHSHDHGEEEGHEGHGHEEEEAEEEMSAAQRRNITIAITAGVYIFLLFEKLIHVVLPSHSHSHGGDVIANPNVADVEMKEKGKETADETVVKGNGICDVDSVAWMVIVGDALHNFADGLVMGAAFTKSLATGLGTTIAVFCHEVPHELGDFAVMLNAGMKIKFAVLFNFLSACTCFLGLFVGLVAASNDDVQKWIFAFTAGMFIYIACADLIPEMNKMSETSTRPKLNYALQQLGVFLGFLVMYIIALYEGELENIGGGDAHHHH